MTALFFLVSMLNLALRTTTQTRETTYSLLSTVRKVLYFRIPLFPADNGIVTIAQLFDYFGVDGLRQILQSHGLLRRRLDPNDFRSSRHRRRRRQTPLEDLYPKIPNEEGKKLMASGTYGSNSHFVDRMKGRDRNLHSRLLWRELDSGPLGARRRASMAIAQVSS